jgi:predicted glycoside hydrolase/deacetylase ChbG (UPF0249 family)
MGNKLIFNSDDFGISSEVNRAIADSFRANWISSATILVNMDSSREAFEIIRSEKLKGRIGLHLNFQEGKPLSSYIQSFSCCGSDGRFNYSFRNGSHLWRSPKYLRAIQLEIEAQIQKFHDELGFYPSHIDSHDHSHTELFMLIPLSRALRKVPPLFVRPTRNIGEISVIKMIYKHTYRIIASLLGIRFVKYFGSIDDLISLKKPLNSKHVFEIETHCIYDENSVLRDIYDSYDDEKFKILTEFNLVSYSDLTR